MSFENALEELQEAQSSMEVKLERQQEVSSNLRRKVRNQKSQLKQLNTAILRKNHEIRCLKERLTDTPTVVPYDDSELYLKTRASNV